jgi:endonuclease/exonuclease/phosphatase family metal-dependent hydrolase
LNSSGIHLQDAKEKSKNPAHGPSATFIGFQFEANDQIDYILVTENITVINYGVLADVWDNNFPPSDHRPIIADVTF